MSGPRRAHLIVTGGGGYLGRALVEAARVEGRRVTLLSRGAEGGIAWRLGEPLPPGALDPDLPPEDQVMVHLAHDWADGGDLNLDGARVLRDSARALGVGRTVFVSSLSARPDALNRYGRVKAAVEGLFDRPDAVSLRVGLVYGGPRVAMYGLLCKLVGLTSLLPMVGARQPVQPIHRDEVARGILLAADSDLNGAVGLAGPEPMSFAAFLDTLALRARAGRLRTLGLPLAPVLALCDFVNAARIGPRVDRERILGLAGVRFVDTRADLARLGLTVQPFSNGMLGEPAARRAVLAEGRALLRYILGAEPGGGLTRRYARAVANRGEGALRMGPLLRRTPWLLRLVEPLDRQSPFGRRLHLAMTLAEASPQGDVVLSAGNRPVRLLRLAAGGLLEILALPVRLAMSPRWG